MKRAWTALLAVALLCTGCARSVSEQPEVQAMGGAPQTMPDTAAPESAFPAFAWTTENPPETEPEVSADPASIRLDIVSCARRTQLEEAGCAALYADFIELLEQGGESLEMTLPEAALCVQTFYESSPAAFLIESFAFAPDAPSEDGTASEIESETETAAETEPETEPETAAETDAETEPEPEEPSLPALPGTLRVTYKTERAVYLERLAQLRTHAARILVLSGATEAQSDEERLLLLYRWTAKSITDWTGSDVSAWQAITSEGKSLRADGASYPGGGTQAMTLQFLWMQLGLDCAPVTAAGSGTRLLSGFRLREQWYYADPNYEMADSAGEGLRYFGMNDAACAEEGLTAFCAGLALPEGYLTVPEELAFSGIPGEELAASDTAYAAFRSSIHAEFAADHTGVTLASWGSDPVFYSFRD